MQRPASASTRRTGWDMATVLPSRMTIPWTTMMPGTAGGAGASSRERPNWAMRRIRVRRGGSYAAAVRIRARKASTTRVNLLGSPYALAITIAP